MHSWICHHRSTHHSMVFIFILWFSERPFSGLVGKAASFPIILHPPSGAAGICPLLGFFCFTRCVVQHLGLLEKSRGLCSVLEGSILVVYFFVSNVFRRRLQRCRKFFYAFCVSWTWGSVWILLTFLSLVAGSSRSLNQSVLEALSSPFFPVQRGSKVLRGTALRLRAISRKGLSLTSIIVVPLQRRSHWDVFPYILQAFLYRHIYSCYVEYEIIK